MNTKEEKKDVPTADPGHSEGGGLKWLFVLGLCIMGAGIVGGFIAKFSIDPEIPEPAVGKTTAEEMRKNREATDNEEVSQAERDKKAQQAKAEAPPTPAPAASVQPVLKQDGSFTALSTEAWSTSVAVALRPFRLVVDLPVRVQVTLRDGEVRDFTISSGETCESAYRKRYGDSRITTDVESVALRATSSGQQGRVNVQ